MSDVHHHHYYGGEAPKAAPKASKATRAAKRRPAASKPSATPSKPRKPRKPSAYNLHMKKELKALRKKHPRTTQPQLMKKAAKSWRAKKKGRK